MRGWTLPTDLKHPDVAQGCAQRSIARDARAREVNCAIENCAQFSATRATDSTDADLALPVRLIAKSIPGLPPPAIRLRKILKILGRSFAVRVEWLPTAETPNIDTDSGAAPSSQADAVRSEQGGHSCTHFTAPDGTPDERTEP